MHLANGLLRARVNYWYFLATFGINKPVVDEQLHADGDWSLFQITQRHEQDFPYVLAWVRPLQQLAPHDICQTPLRLLRFLHSSV